MPHAVWAESRSTDVFRILGGSVGLVAGLIGSVLTVGIWTCSFASTTIEATAYGSFTAAMTTLVAGFAVLTGRGRAQCRSALLTAASAAAVCWSLYPLVAVRAQSTVLTMSYGDVTELPWDPVNPGVAVVVVVILGLPFLFALSAILVGIALAGADLGVTRSSTLRWVAWALASVAIVVATGSAAATSAGVLSALEDDPVSWLRDTELQMPLILGVASLAAVLAISLGVRGLGQPGGLLALALASGPFWWFCLHRVGQPWFWSSVALFGSAFAVAVVARATAVRQSATTPVTAARPDPARVMASAPPLSGP